MQKRDLIEVVKLLIDTYDNQLLIENKEKISGMLNKLDTETIEELLFRKDEHGIKSVDSRTLNFLRDNNYDMKNICFDNINVSNHNYSNLLNMVINVDKIYAHDISNTVLNGVKIMGSLDNAVVNGTNFKGYKGKLILNPQKVKNKDLSITVLDGVIIDGLFDDCDIFSVNFEGVQGGVYINPQKVKNKDLRNVNFDGVNIIGDSGKKPSFKDCKIRQTSFKGAKGIIEINPQELDIHNNYLLYCNFNGVKFTGGFENLTLLGNEFKGSENAVIDLNSVRDARIITQKTLDDVDYIPIKEKNNTIKIFSKILRRNTL